MSLAFWQALILTTIIETPIYAWFYRKRKWWKISILSFLLNAVTLSFVWFIFFPSIADYAQAFVSSELYVFAAEAIVFSEVYKKEGWRNAAVASAFANAASAGIGLLLTFYIIP